MTDEPGSPATTAPTHHHRRSVRVDISTGSVVLALIALGVAIEAAQLFSSARRVLSWVVACAVVAALIELIVQWLDKYVRRWIAIILVLLAIAGSAGVLMFGVFHDLDREVNRLQDVAPVAAHDIEQSRRFGAVARELHFERRVQEAVDRLREPSSGLAGKAVSSFGTYTICVILTVLFLSWGPRLAQGGLNQLSPERRRRIELIGEHAFSRARMYVTLALLQSVLVGIVTFIVCWWADLPAAIPLSLVLTAAALVPAIGILVGSLPILLIAGGLTDGNTTMLLGAAFIAMQVVSTLVIQPRIVREADLYVGPAVIVIAFLAGFELYGIGGAMYAAALFILGTALIDAAAEILRKEQSETDRVLTEA
jgi:predicted PurR-regulated permease PerM